MHFERPLGIMATNYRIINLGLLLVMAILDLRGSAWNNFQTIFTPSVAKDL